MHKLSRGLNLKIIASMTLLLLSLGNAWAAERLNAIDGIAMDGFDVVAYFNSDAPAKGTQEHAVEYKGATWLFSSADNAKEFESNPEKFEPQFNGWCAYAVSQGYGADVDFINAWAIDDGKLYLNWNAATKGSFLRQKTALIPLAHDKWSKVGPGLADGSVPLYFHKDYPEENIVHPQQLN